MLLPTLDPFFLVFFFVALLSPWSFSLSVKCQYTLPIIAATPYRGCHPSLSAWNRLLMELRRLIPCQAVMGPDNHPFTRSLKHGHHTANTFPPLLHRLCANGIKDALVPSYRGRACSPHTPKVKGK